MQETGSHALVLTSAGRPGVLDTDIVDHVERLALDREPALETRWLAPHAAWEALLAPSSVQALAELRERVAARTSGRPIDVNIVPADPGSRRKKLLVADMESTIIEQECLDEIADFAGLRTRIANITERAMRGELDFAAALRERVGLLGGLDASVLERVY